MPTRAQVRRAIEWEEFRAKPRLKRGARSFPGCVTCGSSSTGAFAKGEPRYDCAHGEPFRIDAGTLQRGRAAFGKPARKRRRE